MRNRTRLFMRHITLLLIALIFSLGLMKSAAAAYERSYEHPAPQATTNTEDAYTNADSVNPEDSFTDAENPPTQPAESLSYQQSAMPESVPSNSPPTPMISEPITSSPPSMIADKNKNYFLLREMLPLYENAVRNPWPIIPNSGELLQVGSRDDTVLLIRERLKRTNDLEATTQDSDHFDRRLAEAVKLFQWRHGLKPDGVVGEKTIAEFNVSPEERVREIQINMERWARLSNQLDDRYIMVNIPEYKLHVVDNGREVLNMKVIVGKPDLPTPELSSTITRVIFNPPWNIPYRIAKNDIIPKVLEDPNYLDENNIRVFNSPEEDSYEIDPHNVDWNDMLESGSQYHFRQDPGLKNALGLVKFEFKNSHNVYLHDTPAKSLFSSDERDLSHGCIRLEKPFTLVSYLIENDVRLDNELVGEILESQKTRYFKIRHPIPIYITYITAWVDDNKIVHFADDVYNIDQSGNNPDLAQRNIKDNFDEDEKFMR